ncbi:hypothetical protein os1_08580 [Comamonadaceae bacterium OS-1]|nr:hypothetical protein os1_08580 [Comamonadaceae bacterium OS-1]
MLKGLALTPPVIGRISIGKIVEKSGKRLPEKDDEFTVTSQVQNKDGWVNHPVDEALRHANANGKAHGNVGGKLRTIPVRLLFDDPDLNLRANYSLFDRQTGRPVCVGNGETCKRSTSDGIQTLTCPSPDSCELARGGYCKPYGRLHVRISGEVGFTADGGAGSGSGGGGIGSIGGDDELGSFVFRTTGFNSIRTLSARLKYFQAVSGGLLSTLPLELRLRGKSTAQSHRAAIYYVDLTVKTGMTLVDAMAIARAEADLRKAAGFDQAALDEAARQGYANGAFEESEEEGAAVVEEFYPLSDGDGAGASNDGGVSLVPTPRSSLTVGKPRLASKLERKVAQLQQISTVV